MTDENDIDLPDLDNEADLADESWDEFDDNAPAPAAENSAPAAKAPKTGKKSFFVKNFNAIVIAIVALGGGSYFYGKLLFPSPRAPVPAAAGQNETAQNAKAAGKDGMVEIADNAAPPMPAAPADASPKAAPEAAPAPAAPPVGGDLTPMPGKTDATPAAAPEAIPEAAPAEAKDAPKEIDQLAPLPLPPAGQKASSAKPAPVTPVESAAPTPPPAAAEAPAPLQIEPAQLVADAPKETPPPVPAATPAPDDSAAKAKIAELENKVASQKEQIDALNKKLDAASKAAAAAEKAASKAAAPPPAAPAAKPAKHAPAPQSVVADKPSVPVSGESPKWVLRSAQPGLAVVAPPGSDDLRSVQVGDALPGLGRIISIGMDGGKWVVRGSKGQISR